MLPYLFYIMYNFQCMQDSYIATYCCMYIVNLHDYNMWPYIIILMVFSRYQVNFFSYWDSFVNTW